MRFLFNLSQDMYCKQHKQTLYSFEKWRFYLLDQINMNLYNINKYVSILNDLFTLIDISQMYLYIKPVCKTIHLVTWYIQEWFQQWNIQYSECLAAWVIFSCHGTVSCSWEHYYCKLHLICCVKWVTPTQFWTFTSLGGYTQFKPVLQQILFYPK